MGGEATLPTLPLGVEKMGRANLARATSNGRLYDTHKGCIGFAEGLVGGEATLPTPTLGVGINAYCCFGEMPTWFDFLGK